MIARWGQTLRTDCSQRVHELSELRGAFRTLDSEFVHTSRCVFLEQFGESVGSGDGYRSAVADVRSLSPRGWCLLAPTERQAYGVTAHRDHRRQTQAHADTGATRTICTSLYVRVLTQCLALHSVPRTDKTHEQCPRCSCVSKTRSGGQVSQAFRPSCLSQTRPMCCVCCTCVLRL